MKDEITDNRLQLCVQYTETRKSSELKEREKMSDKRKAGGSACDQRPETERQFLERTNVASQIRDVLAKVRS